MYSGYQPPGGPPNSRLLSTVKDEKPPIAAPPTIQTKRRRTAEDFFSFCNFILEYENYDAMKQEELRTKSNGSPLGSTGSTTDSIKSEECSSTLSSSSDHMSASPLMSTSATSPSKLNNTTNNINNSSSSSNNITAAVTNLPIKRRNRKRRIPEPDDDDGAYSSMSSPPAASYGNRGDEDSYDLVTCFCMKPFAGRPMIECSQCLTWLHLSCAKVRKNNIPEDFLCQRCKDAKQQNRRSERVRGEGGAPISGRRSSSSSSSS